jgi:ankyrin repeat protein
MAIGAWFRSLFGKPKTVETEVRPGATTPTWFEPRPTPKRERALFAAIAAGDVDTVRRLAPGADLSARDDEHASPLGRAIMCHHHEVTSVVLAAGADPGAPARQDQPALHVAAAQGCREAIEHLLAAGAARELCDPDLGSALCLAIVVGADGAAEALMDAGVPLDLPNSGGARPIHIAAFTGQLVMVEQLIRRGADIHSPNGQGGTPLRSAADAGHLAIVERFLAAGADPHTIDDYEKRPIDYARDGGHTDIVALLERTAGATTDRVRSRRECSLVHVLPPRTDATINGLLHARERGDPVTTVGTSGIEAPSMVAAIAPLIDERFRIAMPIETDPDPRIPTRSARVVLWTYRGIEARPAVGRPELRVLDAVAALAERPYFLPSWSERAEQAARRLGEFSAEDIVAAMVHPPGGPPYLEPWNWVLRVQVAAALIVSYADVEPWAHAPRREVLEAVLDGPADWTNTAAAIALFDVARRDEAARDTVIEALARAVRRPVCPAAFQHAITPAAQALVEVPGVSPDLVAEARRILADA